MFENVVKNFKEEYNNKQIISILKKEDKIVFSLLSNLIEKALDEIDNELEKIYNLIDI